MNRNISCMCLPRLVYTLLLVAQCFLLGSCRDDDRPDPNGVDQVGGTERTTEARFNLDGNILEAINIESSYSESPESLNIFLDLGDGNSAEMDLMPIPGIGEHITTPLNLGFAITIGQSAYFCNEDCLVQIQEHDRDARWLRLSVSGSMSESLTGSASLSEGRIGLFY